VNEGEQKGTYRGMWKNMRAFGFASLLVSGVTWDWRFQMSPKSFPVSDVKGRSIGLMEPA
jgi:hypothetical protein